MCYLEATRVACLRSCFDARAVLADEILHLHSVDQLRRFSRSGFSRTRLYPRLGGIEVMVLRA